MNRLTQNAFLQLLELLLNGEIRSFDRWLGHIHTGRSSRASVKRVAGRVQWIRALFVFHVLCCNLSFVLFLIVVLIVALFNFGDVESNFAQTVFKKKKLTLRAERFRSHPINNLLRIEYN